MSTYTEIIRSRLSKMAVTPLEFYQEEIKVPMFSLYASVFEERKVKFGLDIRDLNGKITVDDRVLELLRLTNLYQTRKIGTKKLQCGSARNRSSVDLWRLYKHYYGEINFSEILHSLYRLTYEYKITHRYCFVVKKHVFNKANFNFNDDAKLKGELGVAIINWMEVEDI